MKKIYTIVIVLFATILMANAQSVLVSSNWSDLDPVIANGTSGKIADSYSITGGTFNFAGARYNDLSNRPTIIPSGGTVGETIDPALDATVRYIRVGSSTTLTNNVPSAHFYQITPTKPFVNGGKVTLTVSANTAAKGIGVFNMTDQTALGVIDISALPMQTYNDVTFTLPANFNGVKALGFCRIELDGTVGGVTFFTWKVKIETNSGTGVIDDMKTAKVVSTQFINLAGVAVGSSLENLKPGVYIQRTAYDNGKVLNKKVLKNNR
jgi:hypothetical protein